MSFEPIEGFEPTTPRLQITCSGQLSYIGRWVSYLHRAATTGYPCCGQTLGDSQGAGRIGLTRAQKSIFFPVSYTHLRAHET